MCGIAGHLFKYQDEESIYTLISLKGSLVHRGPDDSGIYQDRSQGVALVHTRLSILDVSSLGHQPMASEDGRVVL